MLSRFIGCIFCALLFTALHAQEVEQSWDVTIEVNALDPQANDKDPTTPFRTINAAAQNALGFARAGKTVRVLVHPGTYRERVLMIGKADETTASIKLEGTEPGKANLNGCDIVNGWKIGDHSIFELDRKFDPKFPPMIFIEGVRLLEVDSISQVQAGKVFFDGDAQRIHLLPPIGAVVKDGTVEIAADIPEPAIFSNEVNDLFIESLAVERGYRTGIGIHGADTVVLNNVSVEYCSGTGVSISDSDQVRVRRVFVERCGEKGFGLSNLKQLGITGSVADLNGWHVPDLLAGGGAFIYNCDNVKVWALRLAENHGYGLSLSMGTGAVELSKLDVVRNQGMGVSISGSENGKSEKLTLSESQIVYNGGGGIYCGFGHVYLVGNVLYGNDQTQLYFIFNAHWRFAGPDDGSEASIRLNRNLVVALKGQDLVTTKFFQQGWFFSELTLYDAPGKTPFKKGDDSLSFSQWQETTRTDLSSFFGDPKLLDPKNYNFTPTPQSPLRQMKEWPVRELN